MPNNTALTDDRRQALGEALSDYFGKLDSDEGIRSPDGRILRAFDYCDSRTVDDLIDRAIVPALAASPVEQPADALTEIAQFLTDAVTAAGLLSHGRTDKKLAARITAQADELRKRIHLLAAPPVEQLGAAPAVNAELASMRRMFHAACHDLGLINEVLGLDPEDGGAEPILDAIEELKRAASANEAAATSQSAQQPDERVAPDVPEERHATDPEQQWQQFWREICTNADGSINLEQVKKELSDFSMLLSWVPRIYMHVTGGKVSKENTWPSVVMSLHDEHVNELVEEALRSELEDRASSANETGAGGARRGTPEQIQNERKLTCEAIDGAIAFGYQNTNPPPSDDHWLATYWRMGQKLAELDALPAAARHPAAWVRFRSDGGFEGPIMDSDERMCDTRRKSGAWPPLYLGPAQAEGAKPMPQPNVCGSCGNYVAPDHEPDHEEWCEMLGWKRRAIKAEALNRKFMDSVNGPTHMGEPVIATPAQAAEPVAIEQVIHQVWVEATSSWADVTPAYYAERQPSNRRRVYYAPQRAQADARNEDAYVAKRLSEALADVYTTLIGDDKVDADESLNAIERVERAAQVLRLEVELYRGQADAREGLTEAARSALVACASTYRINGLASVADEIERFSKDPTMPHDNVLTYANQPGNVGAWKLGEACRAAKAGGDPIDHGLSLLKELQARGYGVVDLVAHPGQPEPRAALLYEHDDGRYAVALSAEEAHFTRDDPAWHRVGPVTVYGSNTAPHPEQRAEVTDADLVALLPGPYYMDPPDGGDVTLLEQLRRLAEDAARYRWLRDEDSGVPDGMRELCTVQFRLPHTEEPDRDLFGTALDAAIDAARTQGSQS